MGPRRRSTQQTALEAPNAEAAAVLAQVDEVQTLYARVLFLKREGRLSLKGALQAVDERLAAASPVAGSSGSSGSSGGGTRAGTSKGRKKGAARATAAAASTVAGSAMIVSSVAAAGGSSGSGNTTSSPFGAASQDHLNPWRILRLKLLIEQAGAAALAGGDSARTREVVLRQLSAVLAEAVAAVRAQPSWVLLRLMAELLQLLAGCSGPASGACLDAWQAFLEGPMLLSQEQLLALPHPYVEVARQDSRVRWGMDPPDSSQHVALETLPYLLQFMETVNRAMDRGRQAFLLAAQQPERHPWLTPAALQRVLLLAAEEGRPRERSWRLHSGGGAGSGASTSSSTPLLPGPQQQGQQGQEALAAAEVPFLDSARDRSLLRRLGQQAWLREELRRRLQARFAGAPRPPQPVAASGPPQLEATGMPLPASPASEASLPAAGQRGAGNLNLPASLKDKIELFLHRRTLHREKLLAESAVLVAEVTGRVLPQLERDVAEALRPLLERGETPPAVAFLPPDGAMASHGSGGSSSGSASGSESAQPRRQLLSQAEFDAAFEQAALDAQGWQDQVERHLGGFGDGGCLAVLASRLGGAMQPSKSLAALPQQQDAPLLLRGVAAEASPEEGALLHDLFCAADQYRGELLSFRQPSPLAGNQAWLRAMAAHAPAMDTLATQLDIAELMGTAAEVVASGGQRSPGGHQDTSDPPFIGLWRGQKLLAAAAAVEAGRPRGVAAAQAALLQSRTDPGLLLEDEAGAYPHLRFAMRRGALDALVGSLAGFAAEVCAGSGGVACHPGNIRLHQLNLACWGSLLHTPGSEREQVKQGLVDACLLGFTLLVRRCRLDPSWWPVVQQYLQAVRPEAASDSSGDAEQAPGGEPASQLSALASLPLTALVPLHAACCWLVGESFADVADLGAEAQAALVAGEQLLQLEGGDLAPGPAFPGIPLDRAREVAQVAAGEAPMPPSRLAARDGGQASSYVGAACRALILESAAGALERAAVEPCQQAWCGLASLEELASRLMGSAADQQSLSAIFALLTAGMQTAHETSRLLAAASTGADLAGALLTSLQCAVAQQDLGSRASQDAGLQAALQGIKAILLQTGPLDLALLSDEGWLGATKEAARVADALAAQCARMGAASEKTSGCRRIRAEVASLCRRLLRRLAEQLQRLGSGVHARAHGAAWRLDRLQRACRLRAQLACREAAVFACGLPLQRPLLAGLLRHCLTHHWVEALERDVEEEGLPPGTSAKPAGVALARLAKLYRQQQRKLQAAPAAAAAAAQPAASVDAASLAAAQAQAAEAALLAELEQEEEAAGSKAAQAERKRAKRLAQKQRRRQAEAVAGDRAAVEDAGEEEAQQHAQLQQQQQQQQQESKEDDQPDQLARIAAGPSAAAAYPPAYPPSSGGMAHGSGTAAVASQQGQQPPQEEWQVMKGHTSRQQESGSTTATPNKHGSAAVATSAGQLLPRTPPQLQRTSGGAAPATPADATLHVSTTLAEGGQQQMPPSPGVRFSPPVPFGAGRSAAVPGRGRPAAAPTTPWAAAKKYVPPGIGPSAAQAEIASGVAKQAPVVLPGSIGSMQALAGRLSPACSPDQNAVLSIASQESPTGSTPPPEQKAAESSSDGLRTAANRAAGWSPMTGFVLAAGGLPPPVQNKALAEVQQPQSQTQPAGSTSPGQVPAALQNVVPPPPLLAPGRVPTPAAAGAVLWAPVPPPAPMPLLPPRCEQTAEPAGQAGLPAFSDSREASSQPRSPTFLPLSFGSTSGGLWAPRGANAAQRGGEDDSWAAWKAKQSSSVGSIAAAVLGGGSTEQLAAPPAGADSSWGGSGPSSYSSVPIQGWGWGLEQAGADASAALGSTLQGSWRAPLGALAAQRAQQLALQGLRNALGEYNCFLNAVVQCLWRCAAFRQQVLGWLPSFYEAHPVVAALRRLFEQLGQQEAAAAGAGSATAAAASRRVVDPTQVRVALSGASERTFGLGEMNDAGEVLLTIYESIQAVEQVHAPSCSMRATMGLTVQEDVHCKACGRVSHHNYYTQYFYNAQAAGMQAVHTQLAEQRRRGILGANTMGKRLRVLAEVYKSCDMDLGGCGSKQPVVHRLVHAPHVFSLQLTWPSHDEAPEDIGSTLRALEGTLALGEVYEGEAALGRRYRLRSLVGYYGAHYSAFVALPELGGEFALFDDTQVSRAGGWEAVVRKCEAGRIQPSVLFYEAEG